MGAMRLLYVILLILGIEASARNAAASFRDSLSDARAAREMLGPSTWARIVKIDNSHPRGEWRYAVYPKTVYALIFEVSGILWLYTDAEGTESLSQTLGTVERDEANPGPLLRAIEPGIGAWEWVSETQGAPAVGKGHPPNACMEESIQALNRRIALGGEAGYPQLLFYYVSIPGGLRGHTVLLFRTARGLSAIDPQVSPEPVSVPAGLEQNPRSISKYLRGGPVESARTLALVPVPTERPGRWATLPSRGASAG